MATKEQKRIRKIALELAHATLCKEWGNPSEIAVGFEDYDPETDSDDVYDELYNIIIRLEEKKSRAAEAYSGHRK